MAARASKRPAKKSGPARPAPKTLRKSGRRPAASREAPEVAAFLRALKHPLKPLVEALREVLLDASPEISEGIKWNAPSFRTGEDFATLNLREKGQVRLILHRGAKVRTGATDLQISDPAGLLQWLGTDRCLVSFADEASVRAKRRALQTIIREWMRSL